MSNDYRPSDSWDRVAAELRACREAQRKAWGDTDNLLLGRYLADDLSSDERRRIEAALEQHPDLRLLTDVVREVMADCPAEEEPAILPFPTKQVKPRRVWLTRRRAVLAAACLLLAVGIPVLGSLAINPQRGGGFARPVAFQSAVPDPRPASPPHEVGKTPKLVPAHPRDLPDGEPPAVAMKDAGPIRQSDERAVADRLIADGKKALSEKSYDKAQDSFRKAVALLDRVGLEDRLQHEASFLQQQAARLAKRDVAVVARQAPGLVGGRTPYPDSTASSFRFQRDAEANAVASRTFTSPVLRVQSNGIVPTANFFAVANDERDVYASLEASDARTALNRQPVRVRFLRYEQAMQAASRALEVYRYERALSEYNVALQLQPEDEVAKARLERVRQLALKGVAEERPHVAAKITPAAVTRVQAGGGEKRVESVEGPSPNLTREEEATGKATAALRAFSPVAGHVAETLWKWSEHWGAKKK